MALNSSPTPPGTWPPIEPTRGVAASAVDDHAVIFVASGRDDAAEVYHAEPGATAFEADEAVIQPS
jgi:hypothetical protein